MSRFVARPAAERFWEKVQQGSGCWRWQGQQGRDGYGRFTVAVAPVRRVAAHRFAYEQLVGPIPAGLTIDHLCRNHLCVNPAHLEPVSNRINVLRGIGLSAENARRTHCHRGHLFDEANTKVIQRRGTVERHCRACMREVARLARQRRKEAGIKRVVTDETPHRHRCLRCKRAYVCRVRGRAQCPFLGAAGRVCERCVAASAA